MTTTPTGEALTTTVTWNELEFHRLDADAVGRDLERWCRPYREVYAAAAALPEHTDPPIEERLAGHVERPGFEMAAAFRPGDDSATTEPIAYLYGYQLPPDTPWWEDLEPTPQPELIREYPGRTVALCEGLVRPEHRKGGLGEALLVYFLMGRPEERATSLVALGNSVILDRFTSRGWHQLGVMKPKPGWAPHAALLLPLR
jgi:hypothetical protein